jgi:hypothetical protein
MSERENGRLTLAKRTVRNRIAPDVLGAIKTLNTKEKHLTLLYRQKSAGGANVYL